jgi:hypothetical protein
MIKWREDEGEDVRSYYKGRIKITIRRGRRCKQLLDDLMEKRGYRKLKEEALIALCGEVAVEEVMGLS